jgi:hypothetical protein
MNGSGQRRRKGKRGSAKELPGGVDQVHTVVVAGDREKVDPIRIQVSRPVEKGRQV